MSKNLADSKYTHGTTSIQFLTCSILGFLIKFKRMVALTNKIQPALSFSMSNKFNTAIRLN